MTVETQIRELLQEAFAPLHMELENESHQHSVAPGSETHFRLVMVSDAFSGKRAVARHQLVYAALAALMQNPVHALAMHLYAPDERAAVEAAPASPDCLGGSKADDRGEN